MVLPLSQEYKLKCHLCQDTFNTIVKLKSHFMKIHNKSYSGNLQKNHTPGDITIF